VTVGPSARVAAVLTAPESPAMSPGKCHLEGGVAVPAGGGEFVRSPTQHPRFTWCRPTRPNLEGT
jgi:hypothetical protein